MRQGEVSWTVVRRVASVVTPENEAAVLETVNGRSVRAVEAMLEALRAPTSDVAEEPDASVRVQLRCSPEAASKWAAACELARRVAGEALPVWACAEAIAAECASGASSAALDDPRPVRRDRRRGRARPAREHGLRASAWPGLRWRSPAAPTGAIEELADRADSLSPRVLDARLRAAMRFLQRVDFEIGRVLRQVLERRLHRDLGFESFERYAVERLDLAGRTARRLVRIARAEHGRPEVASAFRSGRITMAQAEVLLSGGGALRLAAQVTLRRLRDEAPEALSFRAPSEVATLFRSLCARFGLEALLDHAISAWLAVGRGFRDYADFERDGWRCTAPACSARRNLQSHHVWFRAAGGPDEPWNRTTLCAFHHLRGVHGGRMRVSGRAPDGLSYELGFGRFRSGDVREGASMNA
ncbi:MAG: HNH endonuclease signature motif containing protein [Myxococcota bacterium]|nr:HNH endonuclease signature motif containing protein [Myxococcota bacterium]